MAWGVASDGVGRAGWSVVRCEGIGWGRGSRVGLELGMKLPRVKNDHTVKVRCSVNLRSVRYKLEEWASTKKLVYCRFCFLPELDIGQGRLYPVKLWSLEPFGIKRYVCHD